jgi:hypothetical protein
MSVYRSPLDVGQLLWSPWTPITTLSLSDSYDYSTDAYLTSVTHNGDGNYSIGIDRGYNRTFPSRAARLFFDVYDGWTEDNFYDRILQIRLTMTTDYADKSGNPYIGIMIWKGVKTTVSPSQTGWAFCMQKYNLSTGQVFFCTNLNADIPNSTFSNDSRTQHNLFTFMPPGLSPANANQPPINPTTISSGYNNASGYSSALILKGRNIDTGTETIGVTVETRYLPGVNAYF